MDRIGRVRVPDVARVERELASLWRSASDGESAVTRACTMNLVVVCRDRDDLADATRDVGALSSQHPARALVVAVGPGEPGLDVYVSAHCHRGAGGATVCSEQVTLEAAGTASSLLPESVLQLLCEDLPVFLWWRRPGLSDEPVLAPLLEFADRLIVDAGDSEDPVPFLRALRRLAAETDWEGNVGDLVWGRTEPWREIVAGMFDPSPMRALLDGVTSIRVRAGGPSGTGGATAGGAYLVGWLASRLGWTGSLGDGRLRRGDGRPVLVRLSHDPRLPDAGIASLRIEARDADRPAALVAERLAADRPQVRITVEMDGTCPLPQVQRLESLEAYRVLGDELRRDGRDPVFEAALAAVTD